MADARIFEDLKHDHDRHRALLSQLGEENGGASGEGTDRAALFETLRKELQAHAAAEEESLYATMLANPDLREEARHSVSEHKEIDDYLGELVKEEIGSAAWLKIFGEMRHRYLHHIDEEESEMFPSAAKTLSEDAERRMAEVFERRKPKELARAAEDLPGDARE